MPNEAEPLEVAAARRANLGWGYLYTHDPARTAKGNYVRLTIVNRAEFFRTGLPSDQIPAGLILPPGFGWEAAAAVGFFGTLEEATQLLEQYGFERIATD